jgi:hypothetical protein
MSFITTNPNPFIINVPELQGVIQTATGTAASDAITFTEYINTTTNAATFNTIGSYNSGAINITSDLYLSNANIYVNDSPVIIGNNTLNGNLFSAFTVNNVEIARLNSNGFGIFTQTPAAPLHVKGSAILQSDTGTLSFYNSSNTPSASLAYTQATSTLSVQNIAGDIVIDAATAGNVSISTNTDLILSGASLFSGTAGAATGTYLRIKLNGTYYKLALIADV